MIVRYTRRAQGDLAKILNFLDARSPRGALSVRVAIKRTIDTIGSTGVTWLSFRPRRPNFESKSKAASAKQSVNSIDKREASMPQAND
jgi:plasmid stabilization system protein ParE